MRDRELGGWRSLVRERARAEGCDLPLDVADELASHLADLHASAVGRGSSDEEARQIARDALSGASLREVAARRRAARPHLSDHLPALVRDLRLAVRQLRRSPGFTATALVTLAIGIGANTAVFTLLHAVLLKSLPVAHADRLYKFGDQYRCCAQESLQDNWSVFSYPFYREIRDGMDAFEELAAMQTFRPDLSVRRAGSIGPADAFTGEFVSGNYFTTLGVQAFAGRLFDAAEDRRGAPPLAVVSYATWQRYGFDASAIGSPLAIAGVSVTLVGVTPPGFFGDRLESRPPDVWMPLSVEPTFMHESSMLEEQAAGWLYIVGRLRPGAQPPQVQAQLTAALRNYLRVPGHINPNEDRKKIEAQVVHLVPGGGGINAIRDDYEQGLFLLLAVSAAVLLIACANLANLLLVRGAAQRVRTAVELAMGASRRQILRRHLTESLVLALAGGAVGLLTAIYATRAIVLIAFRDAPHVPITTTPSLAVLLFTFGASLATGVVFGAGPAWLAARSDPADALRGSTRVVGDTSLAQRGLVVLQAALSVVLVTVAALLTQSLRNLGAQAFGFEAGGRLIVQIDPLSAGYTPDTLATLYRRIEDRLSRVAGVSAASLSLYAPQQDDIWGAAVYFDGDARRYSVAWNRVSARYFETIGTPVVRGRAIDAHDTADSRPVVVVDESFARRFFPNQDPIGRHFGKYGPAHARDYEIVGVVKDARYSDATRVPRPMFFVALPQQIGYTPDVLNRIEQSSMYVGSIELHVHGDPDEIAPAVRTALASVDPNLPPTSMRSFPEMIQIRTSEQTLMARLSGAFGAIALLLAAIGLYGVTAYRVARRTSEIGLRMALGASRTSIVVLVLHGALTQIGIGLLAGIPLALAASRALRHQLFGVSPFDAPALAVSALVVAGCAVAAGALAARRAATIAPVDALRTE
jgi:predicted permease